VKGWLLDTNVISAVSGPKPEPRVAKWVDSQPEHTIFLSILTIAEYRKGIEHLPRGHKLRQRLQQAVLALESRFAGRILSVSDPIAIRWGAISGEVKRITGHSPSVVDTLLAATAIEHNLYLATRNVVHVEQSGASVFNPWKDDPARFPLQ
jgi:predicted nucleic acid-binding protein